jgi:hypothetical protein
MNLKKLILGSLVLIMFSASIVVFNISCNKETDAQTSSNCNEPAATFKYKWNGILYEMNGSLTQNAREGSLIRKEQTTNNGATNPFDNANGDPLTNTKYLYSILATKNNYYGDEGGPILEIELRTTSLTAPKTFTSANNEIKWVYFNHPEEAAGEQFTVNFIKIANGYADGSFSGVVKYNNNGQLITIQVTEGEFKNVKILE